jgi:hypothetical protein
LPRNWRAHLPLSPPGTSTSDRILSRAEEGGAAASALVQGALARAVAGVQAAAGGAAAGATALGR